MPIGNALEQTLFQAAEQLQGELAMWRNHIDALAAFLYEDLPKPKHFPQAPLELPRGYRFVCWPSREYRLEKYDGSR